MDTAVFLFAAASLPILAYHGIWYGRERAVENLYGILAGAFAFSGALLVTAGFPGSLILPLTFGMLSLGSLHAYFRERKRSSILKALIFISFSLGLVLMEVLL